MMYWDWLMMCPFFPAPSVAKDYTHADFDVTLGLKDQVIKPQIEAPLTVYRLPLYKTILRKSHCEALQVPDQLPKIDPRNWIHNFIHRLGFAAELSGYMCSATSIACLAIHRHVQIGTGSENQQVKIKGLGCFWGLQQAGIAALRIDGD
ncbi:hypothetical protein MPER_06571 [Moniliophthora perniciosa FA553]|nr:hypothetical protein MPER_06571 [Moniliophthora perniciosa FA553]